MSVLSNVCVRMCCLCRRRVSPSSSSSSSLSHSIFFSPSISFPFYACISRMFFECKQNKTINIGCGQRNPRVPGRADQPCPQCRIRTKTSAPSQAAITTITIDHTGATIASATITASLRLGRGSAQRYTNPVKTAPLKAHELPSFARRLRIIGSAPPLGIFWLGNCPHVALPASTRKKTKHTSPFFAQRFFMHLKRSKYQYHQKGTKYEKNEKNI